MGNSNNRKGKARLEKRIKAFEQMSSGKGVVREGAYHKPGSLKK